MGFIGLYNWVFKIKLRSMKKIYLLAVLICIGKSGFCQTAASYGFSAFSNTYSSISGTGTTVPGVLADDVFVPGLPIGFNFVYCGTTYNTVAVSSNGTVSFTYTGTYSTYSNSGATSMDGSGVGFLMAFWDDLQAGTCTTSFGYRSTSGIAPNRIFTFEWKNFHAYSWTGVCACCNMNMQVKLYETTNIIDFCYGTCTYSGMSATIGIANSFTDHQTLPNMSASPTPSTSTFTTSLTPHPATNQVYRWSPNCVGSPAAITGSTFSVCSGSSITLADVTAGGTWSSTAPGTASVGASTGIVTGGTSGTATISYTITSTGCYAITTVTVNPLPAAITGTASVCVGNTTTLADLTGTSSWTSSLPGIATIGGTTGVVTGVAPGTTTIVFTNPATGCNISQVVTVNAAVAAIGGPSVLCQGSTAILTETTTGGTWSSFDPTVASIGATGIVTGVAGGVTTITYMLPSGCYATTLVSVNPLPAIISGATTVCVGSTTPLTETTGGGSWSSSAPGIASVNAVTGVVTGVASGTATITFTITASGCLRTFNITVNPVPANITGATTLCANAVTTLADATTGGTWSSSLPGFATIGATGIVTGVASGTTTITYMLGTGCYKTTTVNALPYPAPIMGDSMVCEGLTATVTDATGASLWTMTGTGATIDPITGVINGSSASTHIIYYTTTATGCFVTRTFTVNPLPPTIAGITLMCDSSTSALFDAMSGGTWSSSNTSIATIGLTTGTVSGLVPGIDTITYTISATGCVTTTPITVQAPPAPISGVPTVCPLLTTTLSDLITGGVWVSGNPGIASIDSFSGVITGHIAGIIAVTYALGVCSTSEFVTVNPLPASIAGPNFVCTDGSTITLTDATGGGKWYSASPSIATIDSNTGLVTSIATGTSIITYKLSTTGCYITDLVTVDPLPAPITGTDSVCAGYTTLLHDATPGGTFTSSTTTIATVGSTTGIVSGLLSGTTTITYTITATACKITVPVIVNPILSISTHIVSLGGDTICAGNMDTYVASSVFPGANPVYHWTVNGATVGGTGDTLNYSPANGAVIKCVLTSDATCAIPNTATSNTITMLVNPITYPTVTMSSTLGDTICVGSTNTFSIVSTLGGASPVYLWTLNWMPVVPTGGGLSFTFTPSNGDIIRCGMISSSPCPVPDTAFAIDTIVVKAYDTPKVTIFAPPSLSACQGNTVTLSANPTLAGWGPEFYWSINGTTVSTSTSYTYTPTDSDRVKLTMISNYRCPVPSDTAVASLTLHVDPVIIVTVTGSPGVLITEGGYDTLTATIQNGGDAPTYQWYKNGIIIPGATYYKYITNDLDDRDSITCVVTTGSGSACEGVKGYNWIILAVAPAGVNQIDNYISGIKLLPNPNNGSFAIAGTSKAIGKEATIQVTDVLGQVVYSELAPLGTGAFKHNLDLGNNLSNGVYMLRIIVDNDSTVMRFTMKK